MAKTGNPPPRQEAPTYQRQSGIQPVADTAHLRYGAAMQGHTAFTDMIGALGQQVAQDVANEQARLKGIEAAKTPGRVLFPNINETTKSFNDAYRREEAQVLQFEAEKFLNNIYHETALDPNPTSKTLFTFEENAKQGIEDVLSKSGNVTPELRRHLEKSYESKYLHLSERVFQSNRKYIKQQNAAQLELNVSEMTNSMRDGDVEMSQSYHNQALQNIYAAAEQNNTPPEVVAQQEKKLRNQFITSKLQREYIDTPNKDKPKFLSEIREKFPENVSEEDKDSISSSIATFANRYESSFKSQRYINYQKYKNKIQNGELTGSDLADIGDEVDAAQLSKLQLEAAKGGSKQFKLEKNAREILSQYKNGVFLANQTPGPINYAVDKIMLPIAEQEKGAPLNLSEQAELLNSFNAPVESYQKRLSAALDVGNNEQKLDAAMAIDYLKERNPKLLDGMSKNDLSLASMYAKYIHDPKYQGPDGLDLIKDKMINITPEVAESRRMKADTYFRDNRFNDSDYLEMKTYKALDIPFKKGKSPTLKEGITIEYANLVRDGIYETGDVEIAEKDAASKIKSMYGEYGNKIMYEPPTKVYTDMGYVLENSKLKEIKDMVDTNNEIKNNGGFIINDLQWEDAPDVADLLSRPLSFGNPKIKVDGVLRDIVIDSDPFTRLSPYKDISWPFCYLDEYGQMMPIINPFSSTGTYRFKPSEELYSETQNNPEVVERISKYEEEQLQKALKIREEESEKEDSFLMKQQIESENPYGY